MYMRHHVDLGSNEMSGYLGHFIISLASPFTCSSADASLGAWKRTTQDCR